jgi:hypothetical protein
MQYKNPDIDGNSEKYRTGKKCIERGCNNPAGTAWSPLWCVECNIKRMDSITNSLLEIKNFLSEEDGK